MPRYPDDFKEYLKDVAPVHEVIQSITGSVIPAGHQYVANCPFHEDSNPSLMINPSTNTWSCNGCGAGSKHHSRANSADVYGFIKGYYNLNFGEAIEWLAKFMNVPLPVLDAKQQHRMNQHNWWVEKCNAAQRRFQENLLKNQEAYKYMRNRGFEDLDLHNWGIGFGDGEDPDFSNTKGKITFPIFDYSGDIISFTGRVPFGKEALKQLNERQKEQNKRVTPKYDHRWPLKKEFFSQEYIQNHPYPEFDRNLYLYGMAQAKSYIAQWKSVYLVEGFTDVMQMHRHGMFNTTASLGTNLSQQHVNLLKRAGARMVILMRDGDSAGLDAMEKDAKILKANGFDVMVCPLPLGHDPDTLAQTFSILDDSFSKYITKRIRTLTQWRVEKVYREHQDELLFHYSRIGEIQEDRLERIIQILSSVQDPIQLDVLTRQYAEMFVISYEALRDKVSHQRMIPVHQ